MNDINEIHLCDWPDCMEEGCYPAPKNPKNLRDRFHFCLEHVRAYNKEWDGLKGFSENDLHSMRTGATWDRPTWKIGLNSPSKTAAETIAGNFRDPYKLFDEDTAKRQAAEQAEAKIPAEIKDACALLNLPFPIEPEKAKQQYRKMVKANHPDLNQSNPEKAERQLKEINLAFQKIKAFLNKKS